MVLPQLPLTIEPRVEHAQGGNAEMAVPESHDSSAVQEIEDLLPPASPSTEPATEDPLPDWGVAALS